MKSEFLKKRILYIVIINLFIFIILYALLIFSIKTDYNYNSINSTILTYTMKKDISSIEDILKYANINNILNEDIVFNNEIIIKSSIDKRHCRANCTILLYGHYRNYDSNTIYNYNELSLLDNYDQYTTAGITYYSDETFQLSFMTRVPNINTKHALRFIQKTNPFIDYHLENNEIVRNNIKIKLKNYYIIIIVIIATTNLILYYIIHFLKYNKNKV